MSNQKITTVSLKPETGRLIRHLAIATNKTVGDTVQHAAQIMKEHYGISDPPALVKTDQS